MYWSKDPRIITLLASTFLYFGVESAENNKLVAITKFEVPPHVKFSNDVVMNCEYQINKPDRLNMVQWHHNDKEFFRYTEYEKQKKELLDPEGGILVDLDESSATNVVLRNVNHSASGVYTCLVIGESPNFKTDSKEANMTVVVIPKSKPLIEPPLGDSLRPGSIVNLNCSGSPSIPAATLEWKVNGKAVPESYLTEYPQEKNEEGLFVSKLGLHFKVEKKHFVNSTLNLKCVSKIPTLYDKSDEHNHQLPHGSRSSNQIEPPAQPAIGSDLRKSNDATKHGVWNGLIALLLVTQINLR